jgi:hypothetical protein
MKEHSSKEQQLKSEVMVEDFVRLFEPLDYEDKILAALNSHIRQSRHLLQQQAKQRELMRLISHERTAAAAN